MALAMARVSPGLYKCGACQKRFRRKDMEIDHIVPCGSLRSLAELEGFVARLTPESPEAFMVLCKQCHQTKTNNERKLKEKD